MPYLKWSENAILGVQKAYRFLAEKDKDAAKTAAKVIKERAGILRKFPEAGRPADDLDPEHRELLIPFGGSGYFLIYEILGDVVHILAVRHQKEAGY